MKKAVVDVMMGRDVQKAAEAILHSLQMLQMLQRRRFDGDKIPININHFLLSNKTTCGLSDCSKFQLHFDSFDIAKASYITWFSFVKAAVAKTPPA